MRTFTYANARDARFCDLDPAGERLTVVFGPVGREGQRQVKDFSNEETARREHDRRIAQKLEQGYRETTLAREGPEAIRQALQRAILDDPEDGAAHAAYADFLTEQGDPR